MPSAIRVNMFKLRFATDCQPRTKNGQPPHATTGVASASSSQPRVRGEPSQSNETPGNSSPIATATSGTQSTALTRKRRVM